MISESTFFDINKYVSIKLFSLIIAEDLFSELFTIRTGKPSKDLFISSSVGLEKSSILSASENKMLKELSIKNISSTLLKSFSERAIC